MSKAWSWVAGIFIALCILGLMAAGRAERRSYWVSHGAVMQHVQQTHSQVGPPQPKAPGR